MRIVFQTIKDSWGEVPMVLIVFDDYRTKPRPKLSSKQIYIPSNYAKWKNESVRELREKLPMTQPFERCKIYMSFYGPTQADPDNAAGGILDVLVGAGVIADDRFKNISKLLIRYNGGKDTKVVVQVYGERDTR